METVERIITRFSRALDSYDLHADAQQQICRKLTGILSRYTDIHFQRALEIGCGTGGFTRLLKESCVIDEWYLNDICDGCREKVASLFPGQSPLFIAGNAEEIDFPGRFDLIASASAFQWMKEPVQFLHKQAGMLSPNGTLLFNTFAPGNLTEIKQLTGKGLTYPSGELLTEWLEEDFHLIHLREEEIILTFDTPFDVLRHLKHTGVTATGDGTWTRGKQTDFCRDYQELFHTNNNQVTLTYRPLYVLAVKKQA